VTVLLAVAGTVLILVVLLEAFETLILPRRVSRRFRLTRLFLRTTWLLWRRLAGLARQPNGRENFLSIYGPLSLLALFAVWAAGVVFGYALILRWVGGVAVTGTRGLPAMLYVSAGTLFSLGSSWTHTAVGGAQLLIVLEAGTGLGLLALVIAYLPVLYQSFSRRETNIAILDERAGSPPTAGELLVRKGTSYPETGAEFLRDWEHWAAELLESHLSYPILGFFRSQHDNQSWVAALTAILDSCALVMAGVEGGGQSQAQLTFAMARHAAVDLAAVFRTPPVRDGGDRLPPEQWARLVGFLSSRGSRVAEREGTFEALQELRETYEPYVIALSERLLMPLPPWIPPDEAIDNWQITAWETRPRRFRAPLPTRTPQ